jgi:hypothetical protein
MPSIVSDVSATLVASTNTYDTTFGDPDLPALLQGDSNPRMKRVRASLLLHGQQPGEAMKLELDYIAQASFSETSKSFRRGAIYEEYQQPILAAQEYEKAVAGKLDGLDVPMIKMLDASFAEPSGAVAVPSETARPCSRPPGRCSPSRGSRSAAGCR